MPDPISLQSLSDGLADLVARAAPGVVAVASRRSRSSGFAWRDGLVVTAGDALADEGEFTVTLPGGELRRATSGQHRLPCRVRAVGRVRRQGQSGFHGRQWRQCHANGPLV